MENLRRMVMLIQPYLKRLQMRFQPLLIQLLRQLTQLPVQKQRILLWVQMILFGSSEKIKQYNFAVTQTAKPLKDLQIQSLLTLMEPYTSSMMLERFKVEKDLMANGSSFQTLQLLLLRKEDFNIFSAKNPLMMVKATMYTSKAQLMRNGPNLMEL